MQRTYQAPVDRRVLDKTRVPVMLLTGILLISYCGSSTVIGVHEDLIKYYASSLAWLAGGLLALAIFIIQLYTAEDSNLRGLYLVAFIPDVYYSNRYLYRFLVKLFSHFQPEWLPIALTLAITIPLAILMSYYGEILIFGKRRNGAKAHAHTRNNRYLDNGRSDSNVDRGNATLRYPDR